MAMTNWSINGSIAANLPVQTCRSDLPSQAANPREFMRESLRQLSGQHEPRHIFLAGMSYL
jgi:hypothetical protein